jgi:hypothetical protein
MEVLAMGSLKREALLGVMTGVSRGRVKGPICQLVGLAAAAAKRAMARVAAEMKGTLPVRMRHPR